MTATNDLAVNMPQLKTTGNPDSAGTSKGYKSNTYDNKYQTKDGQNRRSYRNNDSKDRSGNYMRSISRDGLNRQRSRERSETRRGFSENTRNKDRSHSREHTNKNTRNDSRQDRYKGGRSNSSRSPGRNLPTDISCIRCGGKNHLGGDCKRYTVFCDTLC